MQRLYRRLAGLGLALIMIPVFIGLLACMPVPVGNSEQGRIDDNQAAVFFRAPPEHLDEL